MMAQMTVCTPSTTVKQRGKVEGLKERAQAVKQLIDVTFLIESLGFVINNNTNKELRCACIIHGGDNTTSFRVNKELNTWVCFSHKCHETHGNDVFGLVMSVNECTFMQALDYLEDLTGSKGLSGEKSAQFRMNREKTNFVSNNVSRNEKSVIVDENKLKFYKPFRSPYFIEDGFSEATLDYFEIAGGYTDIDGNLRDIIPIRNHLGELMAYSLRDIRREGTIYKKYKLTPGFEKDSVLYNLHNAKKLLGEKVLIVVEGFKSVWKLHELGIDNSVACMGSSITMGQAALIYTYAQNGVVFFFDNDYAGACGLGRSYDLVKGKITTYAEVITETGADGDGLDPADLPDDRLLHYMEDYK